MSLSAPATLERTRSVAEASSRVISGFMRNAPEGTDASALVNSVIRTFAELSAPTPEPPRPHPLSFLPNPQRVRKYKADKPRQYTPRKKAEAAPAVFLPPLPELGPRIDVTNVDPSELHITAVPMTPAMQEIQAKPRIRVQAGSSKITEGGATGNWRKLT